MPQAFQAYIRAGGVSIELGTDRPANFVMAIAASAMTAAHGDGVKMATGMTKTTMATDSHGPVPIDSASALG
ncbi:MAG: hypothetical protein EPN74_06980 [Rhodanobacter sp.]|nr:MAG: hypothetical protein EPN74_06980 [Rhodanobacter sp.]